MVNIRYKRIKKFARKRRKLGVFAQLLVIWYASIFTIGMLTSETEAYFSSASKVSSTIQAGTWQEEWDKSSLKFLGKKEEVNSCEPIEIAVSLKNGGSDMKGSTEYEVYYSESANPQKGQRIGNGKIQPILSQGEIELKFMADKPGNYKFRALQREGHGNKYDSRKELWSETITLVCSNSKTQNQEEKDEEKDIQEKNTEEKAVQMNEPEKNEEVKLEQEEVVQEPKKEQESGTKTQNPNPAEVEVKEKAPEDSVDLSESASSEEQKVEGKSQEKDLIKNDSTSEVEGENNEN
ncbi:amyloid fiber anchoring/assembly protein TapA [Mesobacillus maritimus]|uniref:amyloid fiber anchoring/assembly protein TapA n=1 Tax=Mesobacillus maritimus TaxID=1643336 RepID=UPI00204011DB|nr:amyloid fiber anchoring/assembly protein TapA [Mesobacillus maritimus]